MLRPQVLLTMQKTTAAYLYAEKILQAKVSADVFTTEQDTLRTQSMEGLFDDELSQVIDDHPEDWALDGLSSFTQVLRRYETRSLVEARKKHRPNWRPRPHLRTWTC